MSTSSSTDPPAPPARPRTGARTRGYNYLLYTEFPDVATMNEYRAHPVHQRFLAWLVERDCTPLAFDYLLDDHTVLMPE